MRDHPFVKAKSQALAIGYDDAEAIIRASKEPESVKATRELDAARAKQKARDAALNESMAELLGQGGKVSVARLVADLAANPVAFTWLCRRVQLTIAHGHPPADDEHPENA